MKRITDISTEIRKPVDYDEAAIETALRTLFPYGGVKLGFVVEAPEEENAEQINGMTAQLVARAVSRVTGRNFEAVPESTKDFQGHTSEHCDGLNLEDYFLQLHTLHSNNMGISSEAYLRTYRLSDSGLKHLLEAATAALGDGGPGIDGGIRIFPPDQEQALKGASLVRLEKVGQASLQTLVFVNGFPGNRVLDPPRIYPTHEFFSVMNGSRSSAPRRATFSRVETSSFGTGTLFTNQPLPPAC